MKSSCASVVKIEDATSGTGAARPDSPTSLHIIVEPAKVTADTHYYCDPWVRSISSRHQDIKCVFSITFLEIL